MAFPMAVGSRSMTLVMICYHARGHVDRILWTITIHYLMSE
jgi:small neutral amino acid transporter SnatA (MarC family)